MRRLIIIFLFFTTVLQAQAQTTYYVSNGGGGDTLATIAEVNALTLEAGDSVLFHRGDTWRGTGIEVDQSGAYGSYITFGAYGTGDKPRILGSLKAETWTETEKANVWESATTIATDPWLTITASGTNCSIFFIDGDTTIWGYHEAYTVGWTNLTEQYEWTWNGSTLYVYSEIDPDTYTSVEAPQIQYAAIINHQDYIAFDNLEFAYLAGYGVRDEYAPDNQAGFRFTNMHVHHIGRKGSNIAYGFYIYRSKIYVANCEIHDCGRRAISIEPVRFDANYVILDSVLIEDNYLHDGWHTLIDINTSGKHIVRNVVIRNNLLEGNPNMSLSARGNTTSNHMFLANQCPVDTSVLDKSYNFEIYNNILTNMSGKGIMIEKVDSVYIYNNSFYGWNPTLTTYQAFIYLADNGNGHPEFNFAKNNIFYDNADFDTNPDLSAIKVDADWWDELTLDYNLYYTTDARCGIYEMRGVDIGYWVEGDNYTVAEWAEYRSERSMDLNSPTPANPLFYNPPDSLQIEILSPAVDAGTDVGVETDYIGTTRDATPDLGAYEYAEPDSTATDITSFTLAEQVSAATINTTLHTVAITVEFGTTVTALEPTITLSQGATVSPTSGTATDFTSPVTYTVTALDGATTQEWTVTVTIDDEPAETVPTVTTTSITSYTAVTAVAGGNVTDDGGGTISERGIVWGTSANPTTSNNKIKISGTTGAYSATIRGLSGGTVYHVRAYAVNESGTSYGADVSFTTLEKSIVTYGGKYLYHNGKIVIIQ